MASSNVKVKSSAITHEGSVVQKSSKVEELKRTVNTCMLFENTFYEGSDSIASRIKTLIKEINDYDIISQIAIEAKEKQKLRHVPLFIALRLIKLGYSCSDLIDRLITRPDDMTEILSIYWKNKRKPIDNQIKKGLAKAFKKFNEYQLAKYDRRRDNVKLRDVLCLTHPKPDNKEQSDMWKRLLENKLAIPDTWEVALSSGADKKETFERLLKENKLGALALLRNLRNMIESGVDENLIKQSILSIKIEKVLPMRFISASKYAPQFEQELESAMNKCVEQYENIPGKTYLLIDVSGSMDDEISNKSEVTRLDAACGVAILLRSISSSRIFTFSAGLAEVPARNGFALKDAIINSQEHGGTYIEDAIKKIPKDCDRLIIITDEQSYDSVSYSYLSSTKTFIINVAPYQYGVLYNSNIIHINGWSESVIDFIQQEL